MQNYYFDVRTGGTLVPDEEGNELPDVAAAERQALKIIAELMQDLTTNDGNHVLGVEVREQTKRVLTAEVEIRIVRHRT